MSLAGDIEPGPGRATLLRVRGGLIGLNLLVIGMVCLLLLRFWNAELHDAELQAQARVRQLQQSASATLDEIAVSVRLVAVQAGVGLIPFKADSASFWAVLDTAKRNVPALERMGVFDAQGHRICQPGDGNCLRFEVADRDYFSLLRQRPGQGPVVIGPVLARPGNVQSLLVVQAIQTPATTFAGVVVAVVPVSRLQPLVALARLGPHDIAALRTEQMALVARASDAPGHTASSPDLGVTDILRRNVRQAPNGGSYRAVVPPDSLELVVAYQKLPTYPLYALTGLSVADVMATWWLTASWAAGLTLLLVVASCFIDRLVRTSLERQNQAQLLYDGAPCGYHSLDAQGRYLSINATELQWLGCSWGEVVGRLGPADFFTDEGRAVMARRFPDFQRSGSLQQQEFDLLGRQGDKRRVVVTARAVHDALGGFVQSNSVMHDITALNTAHVELAALSARQQAMLNSELVGMLKERAGVITWTNRAMDPIFGYEPADWAGMPLARLFDDSAHHRQTTASIHDLTFGGANLRESLQLLRKDGTPVWVDVSTTRIDGEGAESFTIVRDITDKKKAEAVHLRAVELEAQNLSLQEASRLKDEFVSNLSHELRTPLNAVLGFAGLIERSQALTDAPKQQRQLRQIIDSGRHLGDLVQTMLDFASLAARKMRFAPELVRVQAALDEAAEMLEPHRLELGVGMSVVVEPGLQTVVTDPLRLRQMLVNLAGNAVKFSRLGGAVSLKARALDAARWCVEVRDEGIGISEQDLSRLFVPFVQLSSGSTKVYGGTGLGLALVRSLARAQGGDVEVSSQVGVGSVFRLVLPRVLAVEPEKAS